MPTTAMTCLLIEGPLDEMAEFYASLVPDSAVLSVERWPEGSEREGEPLAVDFTVAGARFQLIAGGPDVALTRVVSIKLEVDTQAEVDRLWDALLADGGEPSQCGWLTDRYGLSWQLIPRGFTELMSTTDAALKQELFAAMLTMSKLEMPVFDAIAAGRS
ncbi:Glyoxalase superfamily enzyme, possibly 3-demethylubiquinone-9 3-methyltransferase [Agromyces sp. CF514]|uniref:VOC family protein n=1 Tax=Agromyces sp. CF514 TaxID=1881031 RepID=UPI0008E2705E|nr:VOC family protein [Agromyces sp. CF514]SFR83477.1 Glyoxalase superfamily enzyme, possibly 3-demethylubiquinone-9 3-methyltransferase [Agromyces sp. CF514]